MHTLNLEDTAEYLEHASIEHTHDIGHAVVHIGVNELGVRFILANDCFGVSVLSEAC